MPWCVSKRHTHTSLTPSPSPPFPLQSMRIGRSQGVRQREQISFHALLSRKGGKWSLVRPTFSIISLFYPCLTSQDLQQWMNLQLESPFGCRLPCPSFSDWQVPGIQVVDRVLHMKWRRQKFSDGEREKRMGEWCLLSSSFSLPRPNGLCQTGFTPVDNDRRRSFSYSICVNVCLSFSFDEAESCKRTFQSTL